jgi:hypothetical protein
MLSMKAPNVIGLRADVLRKLHPLAMYWSNSMDTPLMIDAHDVSDRRADWKWALPAGSATRLPATHAPRWLVVTDGTAWLTRTGGGIDRDDDRWLSAGAGVALPADSEWVVEGHGSAAFALYELPHSAQDGALAALKQAVLASWQRLVPQPAPRPSQHAPGACPTA